MACYREKGLVLYKVLDGGNCKKLESVFSSFFSTLLSYSTSWISSAGSGSTVQPWRRLFDVDILGYSDGTGRQKDLKRQNLETCTMARCFLVSNTNSFKRIGAFFSLKFLLTVFYVKKVIRQKYCAALSMHRSFFGAKNV